MTPPDLMDRILDEDARSVLFHPVLRAEAPEENP